MPRAARSRGPSWGVEVADPERRWSRRLAPGGGRGGPAVAPSSPGPAAVRPGPEPRPRPRSPLAIPAPLLPCRGGSRRGRVARGAAPRGCVPRRRPAGRRGVARRCALPPGLRPRRTACPEPALSRGGVWFSAGVFVGWRRAAPSAGPGPGPRRERGARGTCGGEGRVCRVGGKGPAVGGDRRAWTPPRPRPLLPSLPRPAPLAAVPPPGVVARRRVPRPGPAQTPVPPPPPPSNPGRAPACAAGPCSRLPARCSAGRPACAPLPSPSPLPLPALSPPARSRFPLPPSLPRGGFGGGGVVGALRGGGGRRLWGGGGSGVVFGVLRRWVSAGEPGGLRSAASSRGRRSGPLVAPPPWPRGAPPGARARARASLRDATSDQTWRPAEFKHISQRRKRN